jgi:hypothetical protein
MANKIITVLPAATSVSTGPAIYLLKEDTRNIAYQATLTGSGAISATVVIEVSNDNVGWISDGVAELIMAGTTLVSSGFVATATWAYTRARITALVGTNATVVVTASVGP